MAIEYKLPFTGAEIKTKLEKVDNLDSKLSNLKVPTKTSDLTNDSGFITSIPSEYVTDSELNAKGYLTEHQDLSGYALKTEIPSVAGLATEEYVNTQISEIHIPTNVSELANDSGFITDNELNSFANEFGGTIEITSDTPTKEKTVITIDPNSDEVNIYTADEIDSMMDDIEQEIDEAIPILVKGVDYWTESDKAEIEVENIKFISTELAKRGQLKPEFTNSIEECTDTSKLYVLPDGYIYGFIKTKQWVEGSKNLIPLSTVSGGGDIYNVKGYRLGVRLNSSATEKEQLWCITTGFLPVTKNSILRIQYWANGKSDYITQTGNAICLYNSSYAHLTLNQEGTGTVLNQNGIGTFANGIYTVKVSDILDDDTIAFVRVSTIVTAVGQTATDNDASKVIITIDEEITNGYYIDVHAWASTGHAFVPADYESRIIQLEEKLSSLEASADSGVPKYWLDELATKANAIQVAMEGAGRNKSAFLWYTDAHWINENAKVSPLLLNYLYMNTPMNKVNFGGDIIGDSLLATRDEMKYLYEWRKAIKDLPNHHSVLGNHDDFKSDSVDYENDNFTYSFLIAPEETPDMVMGGDFYYYIDNQCEKTRYLYLDSGKRSLSDAETAFVINALTTTPSGWHIVAIGHIWWQYASASTPTTGAINAYCQKILNLFDAYNARQTGSITMVSVANSYNFASCGGKVEFCIGGHIHVDYDIYSTGGIPIIITASDANQNRVPDSAVDSGTIGTVTESAVFGIVADYANKKIVVVGVGRGTSRVISY